MKHFLRYSLVFVLALLCGSTYAQEEAVFWENKTLDSGTFSKSSNELYPEGLTYVWKEDTQNGYMKASAFANGTQYAVESRLESIFISLENFTSVKLTFEHTSKYFSDVTKDVSLWIFVENEDGSYNTEWEQVAIPNFPTNTDWTFVSSGDIDLTQYAGKRIRLGFKYTSTTEAAGTWEIKNVRLRGVGNAYCITPSNPATVSYANSLLEVMKLFGESAYNTEGALFYVKAKISKIDEVSTQYGNATFYISDDGTEKSQLMVYHCKYLENTKFSAEDQIKVGDEVIIVGHPKIFKANDKDPVDEITSCYIYSLNGNTKAEDSTPKIQEIAVAQALDIISALENGKVTDEEYQVKGYVVGAPDFQRKKDGTLYGNVNLTIADEKDGSTTLTVFRAKDFDNATFTEETINRIKEGDIVVFLGNLQKFVKDNTVTPELVNGYLISVKSDSSEIKGDANGDGVVDATDIVELVKYMMGSPSETFNESTADINGDGVINAADIVGIVNVIMGAN